VNPLKFPLASPSVCFIFLAGCLLGGFSLIGVQASAQSTITGDSRIQHPQTTPQNSIIVAPKFGGEILGYAIDPSGTEGILSESVDQGNGDVLAATEVFSQSTGKILGVVAKTDTTDDFVTEGVFGSAALVLHQHAGHNSYGVMNPLEQNKFTGLWKPPIRPNYDFWTLAGDSTSPSVAAYQISFETADTLVFGSNVAKNTFGPQISLAPIQNGTEFFQPQIAFDSATNQAVLADSLGCPEPVCVMSIATANLSSGAITKFSNGLGVGTVNGLAVDPKTGIACTTTLIDQGVEFYNLAEQTGFEVIIPNAGNAIDAGLSVAFDPIHSLFLVSQFSSNGGNLADPEPRIYVYDEQGNVQETINSLPRIPISPAPIVLNPSKRIGFVPIVVPPQFLALELQSFSY